MAVKSQVVTVAENAQGVIGSSTKDAGLVDLVTTVISTDTALTGMLGLAQRASLFIGGMAVQSKLKTNSFNFLS